MLSSFSALPDTARSIDPLELYAGGIDASDYVRTVAPAIRRMIPAVGSLLDVGAGGGQLGQALRDPACRWSAIEPARSMQRRLRALAAGPTLLPTGWEGARPDRHDTVLAANIAAPLSTPVPFLARCRAWAERTIVWVVPAQNGPRGLCLAGCLPAEWHGEDETPGIDIVLAGLGDAHRPDAIGDAVDWSFRFVVPSVPAIAAYLADRLAWPAGDRRRRALVAHLQAAAEPVPGGFRLTVPRRSAILVWSCK